MCPKFVEPSALTSSTSSKSRRIVSIYSSAPLSFIIFAMARWIPRSRADGGSMVRLGLGVSVRVTGNSGSRREGLFSIESILYSYGLLVGSKYIWNSRND
ncbi:hypothetical protein I7I53_03945 [Histoplasma capsulatum var. duboisii H88]|uniref:Uncharacterized protein n=1 Tax=Ajellomyces capsulatus (strain H88) TaxID=544711 RepID=A0A8A1LS07_AJEC8|nr:hypothetical protein I7I53_03945 [Histoplasma capsulatum var. duboisii H88]